MPPDTQAAAGLSAGMISVYVIAAYLIGLLAIGVISKLFDRGTAADYFVASRGIGPVFLVLTIFGTTMTSFAIIGSSGEAFRGGIGVYGLMVSWSGIIHSLCFFLVGIKLWALGKRYGYVTQIGFFRDRFGSDKLGLLLFPALVGLVIPYVLMGIIGGGSAMEAITAGAFPKMFAATKGGVPFAYGAAAMCLVVLVYVFLGGARGTTWANAIQTLIFIVLGFVTFQVISSKLGGVQAATAAVVEYNPSYLKVGANEADHENYEAHLAAFEAGTSPIKPREPERIPWLTFLTYAFVPLSVAMFPHLFQHWLTAKSAKTFQLSVVAHPLLMLMVWFPCVLIGVWATSALLDGKPVIPPDFSDANKVLPIMVKKLSMPIMGGLLTAGVLAAIMSSLDSQFLCISSIFSNDIVAHYMGHDRVSDRQRVAYGRVFVILIVIATYLLSLKWQGQRTVFALGVWCFSGFASLSPLVFAALYWRRATKAGAYASVLTAIGVGLYLFAQSDWGADRDYAVDIAALGLKGITPAAICTLASAAAMIIVSLLTPPPPNAVVDKFFRPILPSLRAAARPETSTV
ncbi:MAG: sodium:solute symporter [Phycisphaerae bacterium]